MMKPKSNNLFHFTSELKVLKLILENGIQPRFCKEDLSWFDFPRGDFVAYPMSCFCDIPLSRLSEHTVDYGCFGIGLSKEWGVRNSLNPVIYCPPEGMIQQLAKYLQAIELEDTSEQILLHKQLYKLFTLIKPTSGHMMLKTKLTEKEFSQENEWRFVPAVDMVLFEDEFEKEIVEANNYLLAYTLKYTAEDVRYIFIEFESDIPELLSYLDTLEKVYGKNGVELLKTRIVSLETLQNDI